MIDETNKVEETSTQQALSTLEAPAPEQQAAAPQQPAESPNFKKLREEKSRLERERDEWMRMAQAQQPKAPEPVEQPVNYKPDDLVEWGMVDKELKKMRSEFNQYKEQSQLSLVEAQLRTKYNDLDSVLSKDNLDALKEREPELYSTIYSSNDVYNKAASAYKLIKQMGIASTPEVNSDKDRIAKNMAKPKPAGTVTPSFGSTALGEAASFNGKMTPDVKKKLYEEMKASSKNHYFT